MSIRKRYYTRHPIELSVSVRQKDGWVELKTVDISRRGMFLRSHDPSPPHRLLQLRVVLPGEKVLDVMGRVRRTVMSREESPVGPGMGIEFFVMSTEQQDAWDRFVLKRHGGDAGAAPGESDFGLSPEQEANLIDERLGGHTADGVAVAVELPSREGISKAPPNEDTSTGLAAPVGELREARGGVDRTSMTMQPVPLGIAGPYVSGIAESLNEHTVPLDQASLPKGPNLSVVQLTVAPQRIDQLAEFVKRWIDGRRIFLKVKRVCSEGQKVQVSLVHPDTDAEFHAHGKVVRYLPDQPAHGSGILVAFEEPAGARRSALDRFLAHGEHEKADEERLAREQALKAHTGLLDSVRTNPNSAGAHSDLGWSYVETKELPRAAIESFLAALAIDSRCIDAHRGLSLAYALAGDARQAFTFARSWMELEDKAKKG